MRKKKTIILCLMGLCIGLFFLASFVVGISTYDVSAEVETDVYVGELFVKTTLTNPRGDSYLTQSLSGAELTFGAKVYVTGYIFKSYYATTTSVVFSNPYDTDIIVTYSMDGQEATWKSKDANASSPVGSVECKAEKNSSVTKTIKILSIEYDVPSLTVSFAAPELPYGNESSFSIANLNQDGTVTAEKGIFKFSAEGKDGYVFFGFRAQKTGKYYGVNHSLSDKLENAEVMLTESDTLIPVFVESDTAVFKNGLFYYPYLDEAVSHATGTSDLDVVAIKSGTRVNGNAKHSSRNLDEDGDNTLFTIPSDVTLLLPYASTWTSDHEYPYANATFSTSSSSNLDPSGAWLSLTFEEGTRILNNGSIVVGGTISGRSGAYAGATVGNTTSGFARLILKGNYTSNSKTYSQLVMGENAILSVCGYVTGGGSIDATASGVKVYQPFIVMDYRGGSYVVGAAARSIEGGVSIKGIQVSTAGIAKDDFPGDEFLFPMTQHTIRNIQSDLTIGSGSYLFAYIDLYTEAVDLSIFGEIPAADNQSTVPLIGPAPVSETDYSPLFQLEDGSEVTISYDSSRFVSKENTTASSKRKLVGRTEFSFNGNASFSELALSVLLFESKIDLSSSVGTFMFPYNYSIKIESGIFSIENNMALYPGAQLIVNEGATLAVNAKLFVFDGLYEQSSATSGSAVSREETAYCSAQGKYPTSSDLSEAGFSRVADLIVNGALCINSTGMFGGIIQTKNNGSKIITTACTIDNLSASQQVGLVGSWNVMSVFSRHYAGATLHELDAMVYNSATGELVKLEAGKTYTSYYGELANDGTYSNIVSYTKNSFKQKVYTTSANPASYVERTIDYSATILGEWYTEGDIYAFKPTYRRQDYLWLNATLKLTSSLVTAFNTADTDGDGIVTLDNGTTIVRDSSGTYYLVRKITSDELTNDAMTSLSILGDTINGCFADRIHETATDEHADLIEALLAYGYAADAFFKGTDDIDSVTATYPDGVAPPSSGTVLTDFGATNADLFETYGASFIFDERIAMGVYLSGNYEFDFSQSSEHRYQIGILVGGENSGALTTALANSGNCLSYVLLDNIGLQHGPGAGDNDDTYGDGAVYVPTVGNTLLESVDLSSLPQVNFDLLSSQYTTRFAIRAYLVITDAEGNLEQIYYGRQVEYGLEDYIARMTSANANPSVARPKAFKQFLIQTWIYAVEADKVF